MSTILLIAFIQAVYDYAGWHLWIQNNQLEATKWKFVFRTFKELADTVGTLAVCYFLHVPLQVVVGFYIFKFMHGCDSIYNIFHFLHYNEGVNEYGDWRWWVFPMGWIETIKGSWRSKRFVKGILSVYECNAHAFAGLVAAFITINFWR